MKTHFRHDGAFNVDRFVKGQTQTDHMRVVNLGRPSSARSVIVREFDIVLYLGI